MISLAVPSGSIGPRFESLMRQIGMPIKWQGYTGCILNSDISEVIETRPQDSPLYVARGSIDACITGEDCLKECGLEAKLVKVANLPLTRAGRENVSLVLFVRCDSNIKQIQDISRYKRVATEYPNIARQYLQGKGIKVDIDVLRGKTEALVAANCVDAGIDIVDTGASLKANNLRIVDVIMRSSTVLVANPLAWANSIKREALENLAYLLLKVLNQKQEGDELRPNFEKRGGLISVVAQDSKTMAVLMQAYMNEIAWQKTLETKMLYLWSTSRKDNNLWLKGETSGNKMVAQEIHLDCDKDCALILVDVQGKGNACHTGRKTCFFRQVT